MRGARHKRGRKAYKQGRRAEWLCCLALWLKGYRIIATRYKTHQGEIDIVASRGMTLAFIEVKARPSLDMAADAVSAQQQARLQRTANLFHAHYRGFSRHVMRFDMMLVAPWRWPVHLENAFPAEGR